MIFIKIIIAALFTLGMMFFCLFLIFIFAYANNSLWMFLGPILVFIFWLVIMIKMFSGKKELSNTIVNLDYDGFPIENSNKIEEKKEF